MWIVDNLKLFAEIKRAHWNVDVNICNDIIVPEDRIRLARVLPLKLDPIFYGALLYFWLLLFLYRFTFYIGNTFNCLPWLSGSFCSCCLYIILVVRNICCCHRNRWHLYQETCYILGEFIYIALQRCLYNKSDRKRPVFSCVYVAATDSLQHTNLS